MTQNAINNSGSILDIDNLRLDGNTLSSTDTNGNIILDPDGTGDVSVASGDVSIAGGALVVDPGGATDSYIQYNESTAARWRHGNDATDDSWRLSQGSALGTNDTFVMTSAGIRTLPLQPAFSAYLGTQDSAATGSGTTYTLGGGNALTELFDRNGDFVTTGTFTAPVTGIYYFIVEFSCQNLVSANTSHSVRIVTTGGTYLVSFGGGFNSVNNGNGVGLGGSALVSMTATDTATFTLAIGGNGADNVNIAASAAPYQTYVMGWLVA